MHIEFEVKLKKVEFLFEVRSAHDMTSGVYFIWLFLVVVAKYLIAQGYKYAQGYVVFLFFDEGVHVVFMKPQKLVCYCLSFYSNFVLVKGINGGKVYKLTILKSISIKAIQLETFHFDSMLFTLDGRSKA